MKVSVEETKITFLKDYRPSTAIILIYCFTTKSSINVYKQFILLLRNRFIAANANENYIRDGISIILS